ncbi:hypothetical protein WA026_010769 [Henosepilachna vigintioctopunctata]|uniref:VWFC domain-containing protein n=1 Tax=Henosepilachna vigintioctopunctata TaxID=420089 RepID=A0AAW1UZH2_9CUCU
MLMLILSRFAFLIFVLLKNISPAEVDAPHGKFLYENLGCTTKDGGNSYECNIVSKDHCIFEGKTFRVGEKISDLGITANCFVNCTCLEGGSIKCDEDFCTSNIEFDHPECNYKYPTDSCCPVLSCDPPKMNCTIKNITEIEGALFFPEDTCLVCFCQEGFSEKLEEPYCRKRRCFDQLENSKNLLNKCAPMYINRDCCPAFWICNEKQKIVKISEDTSKSGLHCEFGNDIVPYGHGFNTTIKDDYDTYKAMCQCSLPPLLTCLDF